MVLIGTLGTLGTLGALGTLGDAAVVTRQDALGWNGRGPSIRTERCRLGMASSAGATGVWTCLDMDCFGKNMKEPFSILSLQNLFVTC